MLDLTRRQLLYTSALAAATSAASPVRAQGKPSSYRDDGQLRMGCCYYPEQWEESRWAADAHEMAARGITRVRIGEFAWTLMEPEESRYDWGWLDRAVSTLAAAGLGVVLGTPTASPPEWLVAKHPDIVPVGADGRLKQFGSRRYYSFSSPTYRRECARIAAAMADRYGRNPAVVGWQIDNEYGCHDTTLSYGPADRAAFRDWLRARYGTIARLNAAWATVVWSQQVPDFDAVDVPVNTPTDLPPAMLLDFRRFSSDQVAAFHSVQVDAIRPRSPGRFITHNFMARFTEFDEYAVGDAVDFPSWDSYPLGVAAGGEDARWDRTGNPDITGWQHDLMHAVNPAPFWVMEQQPGAVNWARYNPVPEPGMVRLWAWEAFAYGAATVCHFRWRQALVGPEQMHAGLNRPDGAISPGGMEARQVGMELAKLGRPGAWRQAKVALVFDFQSVWTTSIQPNGVGQNHLDHCIGWYAALRRLGLDVDIVRPGAPLAGYKLVVVPALAIVTPAALAALAGVDGLLVVGPRSGSKTEDFAIPVQLAPGVLQKILPVKVGQVATLREGTGVEVTGLALGTFSGRAIGWREWLETSLPTRARYAENGAPAIVGGERAWYVGCQGDQTFTRSLMAAAARQAGLETLELPDHVRLKRRGELTFAFNYGAEPWTLPFAPGAFLLGGKTVPTHGVSAWRTASRPRPDNE